MTRPRNQHYVPELHLKHFTGADGMVWTYDNDKDTARHSIPKETGFQRNFYSVVGEQEGQYDDRLEEWLSGVENEAAKPYEALLSGNIPEGQPRADFSVYLSSQFVRSPATRRMYAEVRAAGAQGIMKVITETPERFESQIRQFEAKTGPIEKHIRDRLYNFASDPSRYHLVVSREATLSAFLLSDKLLKLFFKMGWQVLASDDQHLISCDSPVTRASPDDLPGGGGFIHKKIEVTFPLSPTRCLLLTWRKDIPGLAPINRSTARKINVERASYAERFLYADRFDSGIQRLAKKHKRTGPLMQFSGLIISDELKFKMGR
jgi:hypothetical protein